MTWTTNAVTLYIDGALDDATPDTVADMPDDLDEFDIGNSTADFNALNGTINRVRVWTTVQVP